MSSIVKSRFPTSEEIYSRIKNDYLFNQSKVAITYFDSVKNRYIDAPFCSWKSIKDGGDIPWHRVYYFKYDNEVIWDRETKTNTINELYAQLEKAAELNDFTFPSTLQIMTWNVLSDIYDKQITNMKLRQDSIIQYIKQSNIPMICLQEVSKEFYHELYAACHFDYHIVKTDLAANNLAFLSKYPFTSFNILSINTSKQILSIQFQDRLEVFIVHLTSNYAVQSASRSRQHHSNPSGNILTKRNLQLSQLLQSVKKEVPTLIVGDFNSSDPVDILATASFQEAIVDEFTYNPELNRFAKLLSISQQKERYDRLFFSSSPANALSFQSSRVDQENQFSDHFPVIVELGYHEESLNTHALTSSSSQLASSLLPASSSSSKRVLSPNKFALSLVIPVKFWNQIAALCPHSHELHSNGLFLNQKWMPHITLLAPFPEQLTSEEATSIQAIFNQRKYRNTTISIKELTFFDFSDELSTTSRADASYLLIGRLSPASIDILRELYEEISNVLHLSVPPKESFNPHLSIPGNFASKVELERYLGSHSIDIEFPLRRLCYLNNMNQQFYEVIQIFGQRNFDGQILEFLQSIFKIFFNSSKDFEILFGGSNIFYQFLDQVEDTHLKGGDNNSESEEAKRTTTRLKQKLRESSLHDYDLLIVHKSTTNKISREEFMRKCSRIFKVCGLFADVRTIFNQHTHYLKIVNDQISYDLHFIPEDLFLVFDHLDSSQENSSIPSSLRRISVMDYSLVDLNSISLVKASQSVLKQFETDPEDAKQFISKLLALKTMAKERGIYGLQYGYLPGIAFVVLLAFFLQQDKQQQGQQHSKELLHAPNEEFLASFCQFYLSFDYSRPIAVHSSASSTLSCSDHSPMHILNPVRPFNNIARTMTKSTFQQILRVWQRQANPLAQSVQPMMMKTRVVAYAMDENELKLFANLFDSVFLRLILLFEESDVFPIPANQSVLCLEEKSFSFEFFHETIPLASINTAWEHLRGRTEKNFGKRIFLQIQ